MPAVRPGGAPLPGAAPTPETTASPTSVRPALAGMIASLPRPPKPTPPPDDEVRATAAARPGGLAALPPADRQQVEALVERLRSLNSDLSPASRRRSRTAVRDTADESAVNPSAGSAETRPGRRPA